MTDNESTPDFFAGLMQPWIAQLRMITDTLAGMTTLSQSDTPQLLRSLQGLPLPGALSAAQLDSFARGVAAQRSSVAAAESASGVRRPAGDDGDDDRPARRVEQGLGRVREGGDEPGLGPRA